MRSSLELLIEQLREATRQRLIATYEVSDKIIKITFAEGTLDRTKERLVDHIYKKYGYTTHMTPNFHHAVVHLYYR